MKREEQEKIEELSKKYQKSEKLIKVFLKIFKDNQGTKQLKEIEEYLNSFYRN